MTAIFYPDVSHYDRNRGVTIQPGTVAVIAKATHGALFVDSAYATYRQQAADVGAVFAGYHWLNHANAAGQAAYYYSQAGATPCMVDAEDMPGNDGYNGPLTVGDIGDFVTALRAKGGVCHLCYLPRWYWEQHMGSPDLTPLARLGVGIVASDYTTYSDDGPGWAPYGGVTPVAWQYTNALPYGGGTSDFNAFKGTVDQFRSLLTAGGDDMTPFESVLLWNCWKILEGLRSNATAVQQNTGVDASGKVVSFDLNLIKDLQGIAADAAKAAGNVGAAVAPTQDQIDAAVLNALQDQTVLKGIGDAIAAHLHVS